MDKYTVQIRRYDVDFNLIYTFENGPDDREWVRDIVNVFLAPHTPSELKHALQTTPLNIMVRKNGKLISYKDL